MSACVFLGPTLAPAEAAGRLEATFLPPVRLGDVHRAIVRLRPRVIGIVDGYFQWAPAVWHKEILWAMQQGVHVFGAGSMGALRAAELAPFGMRGIGRIAAAYEAGVLEGAPFEDDDEVAVCHGPPDSGYVGASEAMVNIRLTLSRAVAEGIVSDDTRRALVAAAKATYFPDRTYAALLDLARPEHAALARWLPAGRVNQKRLDAIEMLDAMRDLLAADPLPFEAGFAFERTTYWDHAEKVLASGPADLLAALRIDTAACRRLDAGELRDWYFVRVAGTPVPQDLAGWIREAGFSGPGDFHNAVFAAWLAHDTAGTR